MAAILVFADKTVHREFVNKYTHTHTIRISRSFFSHSETNIIHYNKLP